VFRDGAYVPLEVRGARAEHVCAFLRRHGERAVLVVATRWHATLTERATRLPLGAEVWRDTAVALPDGVPRAWRCALAGTAVAAEGGALPVGATLAEWPVALLTND
jgi:(1->4)-alpha-D-glucan 1-alpha-D-glucosylmutase